MNLEIILDIHSLVILKEPCINSYKKARALQTLLESQTLFLKMWHYLGVFSVHKLSLPQCGLPAVTLEQLFDLLLMLKSTVFCFIFFFLQHDFAFVFVYHSWKRAGRGKSVHCTEHATESLFSFQGLCWDLYSTRI